jgi:hypothetical protein
VTTEAIVDAALASDVGAGEGLDAERAEPTPGIEGWGGPLRNLTAAWEDVQRTRLALDQHGIPSEGMRAIENRLGRQVRRELERQPVWPWLSQFPGLGGVHVARLVALIGDPHRFPGRVCEAGHHHSAAGDPPAIEGRGGCGIELADGTVCAALVGPLRPGTGTRSLWHYLGLHVVDGRSPRRRAGQRADWSPAGRTAVLQPGGIAEQIVRLRVPHYRDIYDATKERLIRERAVEVVTVIEPPDGSALSDGPEAGDLGAIDAEGGLRPIQIEGIARKVAAKAFVADLLRAMKEVA